MIENRLVEQVLETGMVVAVQITVVQHLLAWLTPDVQVLFQNDLSFGNGSGFVCAQDIHGAEILDGVQTFDDHLLACHRERAPG